MTNAVIETLPNGLTVMFESMPHLRSVAYDLSIPGGLLLDGVGQIGGGSITQELITRGAAGLNAFELSNRFDEAGIVHGESAGYDRISFSGACLPESLGKALGLVADMVLRPTLDEEELPGIKGVMLQDIGSISDSPARHASLSFDQVYLPEPFNRPSCGRLSDIEQFDGNSVRQVWERLYRPKGACLSIAGNFDRSAVLAEINRCFGDWSGEGAVVPKGGILSSQNSFFVRSPSEQVQIFVAYPSAPFLGEHYYAARVVNVVLSGGMFGRLFVEVREKRGLCYSVYSTHIGRGQFGYVRAYAGTTPDRAQATLEVLTNELGAVRGTVTAEELSRAKENLKASLVMNLESPSARASTNVSEWWLSGRVRSIAEIEAGVEAVSLESIDEYCECYRPSDTSVLTLGPEPLVSDAQEVILSVAS